MEKEILIEKQIYVIGPRRLQNELMASFLEKETGIPCEGLSDLPVTAKEEGKDTGRQRLILWDCLEKDLKKLVIDLEAYGEKTFSRDMFVLFNVTPGLGLEEAAVDWGIRGAFYENDLTEHYPRGVRAVFDGELWLSRDIMTRHILKRKRRDHVSQKDAASLSRREVEVLCMVSVGCTNEEIAKELYISANTVKTHLYNIFRKIKVPNRLQAALWAAKNL